MSYTKQQLTLANELGQNAFNNGLGPIPVLNNDFMKLVRSVEWARNYRAIYKTYSKGYSQAQDKHMLKTIN